MDYSRKPPDKYGELYRQLVTVLLLNMPLIFLAVLRSVNGVEWFQLTGLYVIAVLSSYYVFPLLLAVSIIFVLFFFLRRVALWISGAVTTLFVYYLIVDSFAYSIVKMHVDLFWIKHVFVDFEGTGLTPDILVVAAIGLLVVTGIEFGIFAYARKVRLPRLLIILFPVFILLAYTVSQIIHIVAYENNDSRITNITRDLPFYVPITSHSNAAKYSELLPIGEHNESMAGDADDYSPMNYPRNEMKYALSDHEKTPNVVMILLESWRFDSMNEDITPNIHALSERSTTFDNHFSSGDQTTCGIFGLFYGLHPTYWSAVKADNVAIDNPVFIDLLRDRGYSFGVYAKSNFKRHKIQDAIFRGIEVHESFAGEYTQDQDADLNRQVIEFIREKSSEQQPFMAMAFYKSSHLPYWYPESHRKFTPAENLRVAFASGDTDPEVYLNDYHNAVHYSDSLVGDIVQTLDSLGEMDNTIIIVTTDHGEQFNDNGMNYWGHSSNFTQYQVRVPLVLYMPGKEPRRVDYATSHIDLPPTLLQESFECVNDISDYSNGLNLFIEPESPRAFVIGSYVNHAYIIDDNVYVIYPMYTREYKLADINAEAESPDLFMLRETMKEMGQFYQDD